MIARVMATAFVACVMLFNVPIVILFMVMPYSFARGMNNDIGRLILVVWAVMVWAVFINLVGKL